MMKEMGSTIDENRHFDHKGQIISMCEQAFYTLHQVVDSARTGQLDMASLRTRSSLVTKYMLPEKQRLFHPEITVMQALVSKLQESVIQVYHTKGGTSCKDTTISIREVIMTVTLKP